MKRLFFSVICIVLLTSLVVADTTIDDTKINMSGNITLGQKITFNFGEIIDNIINGLITITGGLDVSNNLTVDGTDFFVNSNTGNVGIGTTSPDNILDIVKTGLGLRLTTNKFLITDVLVGETSESGQTLSNLIENFNNYQGLLLRKSSTGSGDYFSVETSAGATQFIIKSTGNVGIGTGSPGEKLQVAGNIHLQNDTDKLYFGQAQDVSQTMDGTNFNITDEIGSIPFFIKGFLKLFIDSDVEISGDLNQTSGNATINNIYGSMWVNNESDTGIVEVIDSQDTWENITVFNQSTMSGQMLNGFSYVGGVMPHLIANFDGVYKVDYSISFELAEGTNDEIEVGVAINDDIQRNTEIHRKIASSGDIGNAGGTGLVRINASNIVTLQILNSDATDNIGIHSVELNLLRIGN